MALKRKPRALIPKAIPIPALLDLALAPTDLTPLPTRVSAHPVDTPIDPNEARTAIWQACGNLIRAAQLLGVDSARLAYMVNRTPALVDEATIARQLVADKAEAVILEGLEDEEDTARADSAARFVLERLGRTRGYGSQAQGLTPGVNLQFGGANTAGQLAVRWDTAPSDPDA